YYRLNVIEQRVPPLRERREDIALLAERMLQRLAEGSGQPPARLHPDALEKLRSYRFPGNVRELENILERAYTLCEGDTIRASDLRFADAPVTSDPIGAGLAQVSDLGEHLENIERTLIPHAVDESGGNCRAAAH